MYKMYFLWKTFSLVQCKNEWIVLHCYLNVKQIRSIKSIREVTAYEKYESIV